MMQAISSDRALIEGFCPTPQAAAPLSVDSAPSPLPEQSAKKVCAACHLKFPSLLFSHPVTEKSPLPHSYCLPCLEISALINKGRCPHPACTERLLLTSSLSIEVKNQIKGSLYQITDEPKAVIDHLYELLTSQKFYPFVYLLKKVLKRSRLDLLLPLLRKNLFSKGNFQLACVSNKKEQTCSFLNESLQLILDYPEINDHDKMRILHLLKPLFEANGLESDFVEKINVHYEALFIAEQWAKVLKKALNSPHKVFLLTLLKTHMFSEEEFLYIYSQDEAHYMAALEEAITEAIRLTKKDPVSKEELLLLLKTLFLYIGKTKEFEAIISQEESL